MGYRIFYRHLAEYLRTLPETATCADLTAHLAGYQGTDKEMRAQLAAAVVEATAPDANWLEGLLPLCAALKLENVRFETAIFCDELVLYDR